MIWYQKQSVGTKGKAWELRVDCFVFKFRSIRELLSLPLLRHGKVWGGSDLWPAGFVQVRINNQQTTG